MHRQVNSMVTLIENLLVVSRLSAGNAGLDLRPADLAVLAEQVVQRYQATAQQHGCTLELRRSGPLLAAVDRTRFDQILTNILTNAIKFGPGQPITVTLENAGGRARVTVRDRGAGIAPADQERIFHRFERVVPTHASGGLGLGLWIARRLIEEMHGRILLESTPGEGASFIIDLPLLRETKTHDSAPVS
jgi:signal transduction histidine kinase